MKTKVCNECGFEMPDTLEYFNKRLAKGGIWSTTAKCRDCMSIRRKEMRQLKKWISSQVGQTNAGVH